MCTLIAIHRKIQDRWLVLAANRDEHLDRPAEGPAIREVESGTVLAPLDIRAGGTWLGMNRLGVVSGLTNLTHPNNDPDRQSRGDVVMNCLAAPSALEAAERLTSIPRDLYNPFNCFVCDRDRAFLVSYAGTSEVRELEPGVCVVGNASTLESPVPKVARLQERVGDLISESSENLLERLGGLCREHGAADGALDETCVHLPDTYGTRSSILLELSDSFGGGGDVCRADSRLFYSDGPPCTVEYKDFSPLLVEFERMPNHYSAEFLTRTAS